jgi:hypothetical protein
MKSNPEEFFRGEMKWQFMYEVSFREALTEAAWPGQPLQWR